MIKKFMQGSEKTYASLFAALGMRETIQEVVAVTGGGGKTTILRRLQAECMERGILHAVSTTTHMQYRKNAAFLEEESLERLFLVEKTAHTVWMGHPVSDIKMTGFSEAFLEKVKAAGVWLLLEADGAKCLPVKAPAEHEPVVPAFATRVFSVYGLDGVGHPIKEKCFRPQLVAELLGKTTADILQPVDIARLAVNENGGKKGVDAGMRYQVILQKADTDERLETAVQITKELFSYGVEEVLVTANL